MSGGLGRTYGEVFDTKISKNLKDTDMESSGDESEEEILVRIRKGEEKDESKSKKVEKPREIITRSKALIDAIEDESSSEEEDESGFLMNEGNFR